MSPSGELVDGVRVVEVAARKFEFDPATIVVREGERVRLKVTSKDVTHGIGIEAYNIDRKLEPGRSETIEFTADKAGRHHFYCTVYCGSGHGDMHGLLVVLDRTQ
jgi:nitrosocyanin